jgi:hypothetical protein
MSKLGFAARSFVTSGHSAVRRIGVGLGVLAAVAVFAASAEAQSSSGSGSFEIRPVVCGFVPTGDHRDLLDDAVHVGGTLAYGVAPNVALVGTFGWSPTKDRTRGAEKLNLFQYDVGVEGRLNNLTPNAAIATRPYAGVGLGGRTYDYRNLSGTSAETNFLGYGTVGVQLAPVSGPIGLRVEVRNNVSAFRGLQGELPDRNARHDMQFITGLSYTF